MIEFKKLDYEEAVSKRTEENIELLPNNLDDKEFLIKVKNFSKKYNLEFEFVLQKIVEDNIFALHFIKQPTKQTLHQDLCAEFISKMPLISNFKVLPPSGKEAVHVVNGTPMQKKDLKTDNHGKSIDFYWEYQCEGECLRFYATHKYTKGSGGSQDNQRKDIEEFIASASYCTSKDVYFFAIADGPYYKKQRKKYDYLNEIQHANEVKIGNRVRVTDVDGLLYFICLVIKEWIERGKLKTTDLEFINEVITYYEENQKTILRQILNN